MTVKQQKKQTPNSKRKGVFIKDYSNGEGNKINQDEIEQARKEFLLQKEQFRQVGDPK